jgi:hypothetical protein
MRKSSGWRHYKQESGALPPIAEEALALTFADRYEASLRHVARWGRWLAFDGVRCILMTRCTLSTVRAKSVARRH